jgi:hypothetical protein
MLGSMVAAGFLPAPLSGPARHAGSAPTQAAHCWQDVGALSDGLTPLETGDGPHDDRNRRALIVHPLPVKSQMDHTCCFTPTSIGGTSTHCRLFVRACLL